MHEESGRRHFLKATIMGAGVLASTPLLALTPRETVKIHNIYPFYGKHQEGILTPAQKHIYFIVLDLHTTELDKIKAMFQMWTNYSANLTSGKNVKNYSNNAYVPPVDTGEADSLNPHNLTLTFGVSAQFFDKLNLTHLKPEKLRDLPAFPREQLQERYSGGDICIQACADDPQVAFHAVRNLVRAARSHISMKWSQSGFNAFEGKDTPRNLFAFKDGTGNPQTPQKLDETVWVNSQDWLNNGSYLVVRRIKMFLETWDRTNLFSQEQTFGRHRDTGAPIGEKHEFDEVDINKKDDKGNYVIPEVSHVHIARKTGQSILRRSYSYSDGIDEHGQFDAGLLFISFQKDPEQFIKIQNAFGNIDKMNEYITHMGTGLFACFAGVIDEHDYLGKALFEQA
ncbi:iron uptake transporter deferrochelatase/peroxidase subunit [Conservatibacter flavescens]|uniref:Deferrochelatase n=1 Tax=Conservatibacter flavescens TaxID=28161 RepID=A0A2M8S641_9PAST|nr:iron uptake transporter deferrochelatase/peroxidase subunit [Conservatibacter flavescens]PJG86617.1 deferrochelatase/peroxidase EfeB [Conservatibacter flavescens]